jgi:hypothetical protein
LQDPSLHFLSLSQHGLSQFSFTHVTGSFLAQHDLFIIEQEEIARREEKVM